MTKLANELQDACIAAARMTTPLNIVPGGSAGRVILQYMPPGKHKIAPFVDGQPMDMEVDVTSAYANVFERANQSLLAKARAGEGDEPFTDFNHNDDAASSRPQRYYWGGTDPKTGGVLLETLLTASGKAGTTKDGETEPDYTRFSPQWVFHRKTFEPLGLPVNQGAFVNRAAFKTIGKLPVVSASDAGKTWALGAAAGTAALPGDDDDTTDPAELSALAHKASSKATLAGDGNEFNAHSAAYQAHKKAQDAQAGAGNQAEAEMHGTLADHHKTKAKDFAKQALAAGGGSTASQTAVSNNNNQDEKPMTEQEMATAMAKAIEAPAFITALGKVVETATKPLADKITALETERKNEATARARSAVMVHVARGAIAPEEKLPSGKLAIDHYTDMMVASAADTEVLLSRLPGKAPVRRITSPAGGAAAASAAVEPADRIIAAARDLRKNSPDSYATSAAAIDAYMRTAEGRAAYEQLREEIVTGNSGLPKQQIPKK